MEGTSNIEEAFLRLTQYRIKYTMLKATNVRTTIPSCIGEWMALDPMINMQIKQGGITKRAVGQTDVEI